MTTTIDGDSVETDGVNDIDFLRKPTESELQTAIDGLSSKDVLWWTGDVSLTTDLTIQTDEVAVRQLEGKTICNGGGIVVGDAGAQVSGVVLELNQATGQGFDQGETLVEFRGANQGQLTINGTADKLKRVVYAHGTTADGNSNDWDIYFPPVIDNVEKAFEAHTDGDGAEGFSIFGGSIFRSTKSFHFHGTGGAIGVTTVHGTTIHGSTVARNTHEIHEEGDTTRVFYYPRFLAWDNRYHTGQTGTADVVLSDTSKVYYFGHINNLGSVHATKKDGNQTITSGSSWTDVSFNSQDHDERGEWATGSSQFTAAESGNYQINSKMRANGAADWDVQILKNGSNHRFFGFNSDTNLEVSTNVELDASDTMKVQIRQQSGSSIDLIDGAPNHYLIIEQSSAFVQGQT